MRDMPQMYENKHGYDKGVGLPSEVRREAKSLRPGLRTEIPICCSSIIERSFWIESG